MSNKEISFGFDKSDSTEILADLAGVLSHDVRTPLRHMSQFLDFFEKERDAGHDDEAEAYLTIVKENIDLTTQMINGLINYIRLGRGLSEPSVLSLKAVSETALDRARLTLNHNDVTLHFEGSETVFGHRSLLEKMFTYLIENAIIFADEKTAPEISIYVENQGMFSEITISDNGPGILTGYERIVFDLFQTGVTGRAGQGIGLGLAYCRRIAEVHGGRIELADPQDRGSGGASFQIHLPHPVQE